MKLLDNAGWEALADCEITPAGARFTIRLYDIEFGDNPFFGDHLEDQSWFEQLPEEGQKFTRIQRITRACKTMIRARPHWLRQDAQER